MEEFQIGPKKKNNKQHGLDQGLRRLQSPHGRHQVASDPSKPPPGTLMPGQLRCLFPMPGGPFRSKGSYQAQVCGRDLRHKLKSHRQVSEAQSATEMWHMMDKNMADKGFTASLAHLPQYIHNLSCKIAAFHQHEQKILQKVLEFIVAINTCRTKKLADIRSDKRDHDATMTNSSHTGLMPPKLNGDEVFDFLSSFHHPEYVSIPHQIFDETCFHACSKALSIWCYTLKWPPSICDQNDYKRKDDWGMSSLEVFFNFCVCTLLFFPIRIDGRSKDSIYIDYNSNEALLNYGSKRAANMQTLCMERLMRTFEKLQQVKLFPSFKSNQCMSLIRLGYAGKHTGVPCRPLMQKQNETMEWVRKFLIKTRYEARLGQSPTLPDGQAIIDFPPLIEKEPHQRWAVYFQIKGEQRRNRVALLGGSSQLVSG